MHRKSLFTALAQTLALAGAALLFVALPLSPMPEQAAPSAIDLAITKTASPSPVLVGDRLTYSVLVQNLGNQKARSVVMTDTLPANVTFASVSTSKGVCTRTGGLVRCVLGNVNRNTRVMVTIAVTPTVTGMLTNSATAATSSGDSDLTNNSTAITTDVKPKADLVIRKTGLPEPVLAGNPLNYTLAITNVGPSDAAQVVVTDTLPLNLSFGSASAGCAQVDNVVRCTLGALASGSTRNLTLTVAPNSLLAGTIINQAVVGGSEADPLTANNTALAINTVNPVADLAINQISAPAPSLLGNLLTYTVTLTNNGPSAASGIVLTDTLPAGVTFSSASATCSRSGGIVVCNLAAVQAGGTATVTIGVVPNATGQITNTVTAAGPQFDPDTANNTLSASTTVVPAADLAIVKTSSVSLASEGQTVTYTIAISNGGPSSATSVIMSDSLPASVAFRSVASSQGTCSGASLITCSIGTLNNGAAASITLLVTPTIVGAIVNTATVTSAVADPNLANNASALRLAVNPVDLSVSKTASSNLLDLAKPLTYTIVVTNHGPLAGSGVRLTDTLPANVILGTVAASQGSCTGASTMSCDLGGLNVGDTATVTVIVTPTVTGTVVNTVVVSADEPDPNPADNVATATTLVNPLDLSIKKTAAPNPAYAGSRLTYTLVVTNSGPSAAATDVRVTDTLPAGVAFASASSGCSLVVNNQVVCSISTLEIGASQAITIAVTPDAAAVGAITNTAVVGSDLPESNPADNAATASTLVLPSADLDLKKTAEPDPLYAGDSSIYILTVVNHGPSTATGVVVTDTLPAEVAFNSASAVCAGASGVVTCTIGALPAGSIASLLIATTPTASAAGPITNTASVAAREHDPGLANNTALVTTTVIALADLAVTKTAAPEPAQSNNTLIYTVRITNTGPSNAVSVSLTDTLPAGVIFNSASAGCAQGGGLVTCALGALAAGSSRVISITVTPQASTSGTAIENTVEVASSRLDPDPGDNSFVLDTVIDPADLSVIKTGAPNPVLIGKTLTYTLVVTNHGPSNATGVILLDTLPPAVIFGAASAACNNSGDLVTCDLSNLAKGSSWTVNIMVVPTATGVITNSALVDANEADNNPANDTATVTTKVTLYRVWLPIIRR